ncbi:MAG: DUF934 domain-containing protein [Betaproteobacteria bacterium]|nr:DUF934 domain-containing protein [Betaproteobacteria bacterium]
MNLQPTISSQTVPFGKAQSQVTLFQGVSTWTLLESSPWLQVGEDGFVPDFPVDAPIIVPLALWRLRREDLIARSGALGVLLAPNDDPTLIISDLTCFDLIAVDSRLLAPGRDGSIARLLRGRHGYRGNLMAVGNFQSGQIADLLRYGFDTFAFRGNEDLGAFAESGRSGEGRRVLAKGALPLIRRRTEEVTV